MNFFKVFSVFALAGVLITFSGCKTEENSEVVQNQQEYPRSETLYIGGFDWAPPATFNPLDYDPNFPIDGNVRLMYETLVTYNQSKLGPARKKAYDEMQALAQANKVNVLGKDSMGYYESWKNPVLRELVPHVPGMFPKKVADCCLPKLTASEVKESVRYLESLGLLVKNRDGSYSQSDKSVSTGEMSFVPLTIQQMHLQMGNFALDAIKNLPLSERNVSGITMGLTQRAYKKIVEELAEFRKKVVAIATEDDGMDRVYRLNLQLFPLTKNIQEMQNA